MPSRNILYKTRVSVFLMISYVFLIDYKGILLQTENSFTFIINLLVEDE